MFPSSSCSVRWAEDGLKPVFPCSGLRPAGCRSSPEESWRSWSKRFRLICSAELGAGSTDVSSQLGAGYGSVPFTLPCRVLLLDAVQEPHGGAAGQDAGMENTTVLLSVEHYTNRQTQCEKVHSDCSCRTWEQPGASVSCVLTTPGREDISSKLRERLPVDTGRVQGN